MSVFTRISACWYMICARPLPCFSGLLLFVRDTLSELLTRSAAQGHWQMVSGGWVSWPRPHSPAASRQLQGGCLGRTHTYKHKVPTDRSTLNTHAKHCYCTIAATHADTDSPDCELTSSVIINFRPGVTFLGQ